MALQERVDKTARRVALEHDRCKLPAHDDKEHIIFSTVCGESVVLAHTHLAVGKLGSGWLVELGGDKSKGGEVCSLLSCGGGSHCGTRTMFTQDAIAYMHMDVRAVACVVTTFITVIICTLQRRARGRIARGETIQKPPSCELDAHLCDA